MLKSASLFLLAFVLLVVAWVSDDSTSPHATIEDAPRANVAEHVVPYVPSTTRASSVGVVFGNATCIFEPGGGEVWFSCSSDGWEREGRLSCERPTDTRAHR